MSQNWKKKQLGWACKLGGEESLGISKVGQTVLVRLMESLMWYLLPALWGENIEKGQWPLLALMPDSSVSPCIYWCLSSCYLVAGAQIELV